MAQQDNSRRRRVLVDVKALLVALSVFQEVSYTLKSPEQVTSFPVAYVVGGSGPRTPRDIQQIYYDHEMDVLVYLYVLESVSGSLALELEDLVKTVVDKVDQQAQTLRTSQAYDLSVAEFDTDAGSLAATGMPVAVAVLTLRALLPARDEGA